MQTLQNILGKTLQKDFSIEDVGMAYKHILASDVGKEEDVKTEDSWKAENIILRIQILEMEI